VIYNFGLIFVRSFFMVHGNEVLLRMIVGDADVEVPFSGSTLRDKYDVWTYEAAIEGDGLCRALTEKAGATGGFTTPLTLGTAPAVLEAMFGKSKESSFVSGTRDLYVTHSDLCAADTSERFSLIEEWGNTNKVYPDCVCTAFELRIHRGEAVRAHLDIDSDSKSNEQRAESKEKTGNALQVGSGERFKEYGVSYLIDGKYYNNIYASTLSVKKAGGCKTELFLNRVLLNEDLPERINSITIRARLFRDKYEEREYGRFIICLNDLRLIANETAVNTADAVIGQLRYVVSGFVSVETYRRGNEIL
jgi:hypothetical protein